MTNPLGRQQFSTDAPKLLPSEDLLDRAAFAEEIAQALHNWRSTETLVVSLCGEWGSGKSTLANFIKYNLKQLDSAAYVVDFNPWEWSGQEKIFEGFFRQIGSIFGKKDKKCDTRRFLNRWMWLGLTLKAADIVSTSIPTWIPAVIGMVSFSSLGVGTFLKNEWVLMSACVLGVIACLTPFLRMPEKLAEWLNVNQPDETLDDLRLEISHELNKLDRPIIVFIDDIDRLTTTEIALVFQLIKANVKLPNIVFFLMFQKSVVVKAIEEIVSEDGSKYLRKIIQVEWEAPIPPDDQIRPMLLNGLNSILTEGSPKIEWNPNRWTALFSEGLWPYFENLRDINRFLDSFKFYFKLQLREIVLEVNPVDLLAIEVLRLFDNPAYLALAKSSDWSEQSTSARIWRGKKAIEDIKSRLDSIVEQNGRDPVQKAALAVILENLFPDVHKQQGSQDEFLKDLRICHPNHFPKYFRGSLDAKNSIASMWQNFLAAAGDRAKAAVFLREVIKEEKIEMFLNYLFAARDNVSSLVLLPLITALFDVADEFPKGSFGIDMFDALRVAYRFVHFRLLKESVGGRTNLIKQAIKETTGFDLVVSFISNEDLSVRKRHPEGDYVVLASEVKEVEKMGLALIRKRAKEGTLLSGNHGSSALYSWQNWSSSKTVAKWVKAFASTPKNALVLLNILMSASSTNGRAPEPFFRAVGFEPFIDLDLLKRQVDSVPKSELSELEKKHVLILETAGNRKNLDLPYAEINYRDCLS